MGHHSGGPRKKGRARRTEDSQGATRSTKGIVPKEDPIDESVKTLRAKILRLGDQFGIEPGNVQQKLRETLLRDIEKLISQDKVDEICSTQDIHLQNERAKEVADTIAKTVRDRLSFFWTIDLPQPGRPLESVDRDELIIDRYDRGIKLSDIAAELRSKGMLQSSNEESDEQTVASAYSRAMERRKAVMELIQEISRLLDNLKDTQQGTEPTRP